MYNGLIDHTRRMLRAYFDVFLVYKGKLNTVLYEISNVLNYVLIKQEGPRSFIKHRKHLDLKFAALVSPFSFLDIGIVGLCHGKVASQKIGYGEDDIGSWQNCSCRLLHIPCQSHFGHVILWEIDQMSFKIDY